MIKFSIYAPKADTVTLTGDWVGNYGTVQLSRQDNGVWYYTTDQLTPDLYAYNLRVDGVSTLDPKNMDIKEGMFGLSNLAELPAPETEIMDMKDVPPGTVSEVWYHSVSYNMTRRMHIYFPPRYEQSDDNYPVLYLLHGY